MEELVNMAPVNFFQLGADMHRLPEAKGAKKQGPFRLETSLMAKYKLPDTSKLCHESSFAKVAIGWRPEGIEVAVHAEVASIRCGYPNLAAGDSVELMLDTRDVKTSGYNTRFCHHFFVLPEAIDGVQAGEITRFRTEDAHELCDPRDLQVTGHVDADGYRLSVFIPAHCLFGYDPEQFNRMGFAYQINASTHAAQHFSALSDEFQIEQQPSLWASLGLIP